MKIRCLETSSEMKPIPGVRKNGKSYYNKAVDDAANSNSNNLLLLYVVEIIKLIVDHVQSPRFRHSSCYTFCGLWF